LGNFNKNEVANNLSAMIKIDTVENIGDLSKFYQFHQLLENLYPNLHKYSEKIEIEGSFDVNLWYSYENDTKTSVITKNITYKEVVSVAQKETTDSSTKDIIVRSLKQPNCISAKEKDNTIVIEIEKELGVEIVGDTKVKIAIEEDEEPWDEIDEEVTDEVFEEIDNNVDPEYIKEEK